MNLLDKIKLMIEARSFYVKKAFVPEIGFMKIRDIYTDTNLYKKDKESMKYYLIHYCGLRIKRLLKYEEDQCRFGWIVWYI